MRWNYNSKKKSTEKTHSPTQHNTPIQKKLHTFCRLLLHWVVDLFYRNFAVYREFSMSILVD